MTENSTIPREKTRILVIDDSPEIHEDYRKILASDSGDSDCSLDTVDAFLGDFAPEKTEPSSEQVDLDSAYQGEAGLQKVQEALAEGRPYALAFVDMRMPPGWDGLQTVEELWKVAPDLQVVICTAYSDRTWDDIVARVGRSDKLLILKKPFDRIEVSQLAVALTEKWLLARQAKLRQADLERLVEERTEQLRQAALHDGLTGLPNRMLFTTRLRDALERSQDGDEAALILLDLDRFKQVNDSLGHPAGDALLIEVAERLQANAGSADTVARLGGDEFAIIRPTGDAKITLNVALQRWLDALNQPYTIDGRPVQSGASMGVAMIPADAQEEDQLLTKADLALYRAKQNGRGCCRVFDAELDNEVLYQQEMQRDIDMALSSGEFQLYYQPIYDCHNGSIASFESLIRWQHPEKGRIRTREFVPIAVHTGQIIPLGNWAIQEACRNAQQWESDVAVSVNISPTQLMGQNDLIETVEKALVESGLQPSRLILELTGLVLTRKEDGIAEVIQGLLALGVRLALDDFGTGSSSLSYIRHYPIEALKLDKRFTAECIRCQDSQAIMRAVASLGSALGIRTIAKGVETAEQFAAIVENGYSYAQGYYFATPMPASEVPNCITQKHPVFQNRTVLPAVEVASDLETTDTPIPT